MTDRDPLPTWVDEINDDIDVTQRELEGLTKLLNQGGLGNQSEIADKLGVKRQTVHPLFQSLEEKGLVNPIEEGVNPKPYEITKEGVLVLVWSENFDGDRKGIRLRHHKRRVKFEIKAGYEDMKEDDKGPKSVQLNNWVELQGSIKIEELLEEEVWYKVTSSYLVVEIPPRLVSPTEEGVCIAEINAIYMAREVKVNLEERYEDLKFDRARPVFSDQHFAFEKHPLGTLLASSDYKQLISQNPNSRIKVDMSCGYPETEVEGKCSDEFAANLADNLEFSAKNRLRELLEKLENHERRLTWLENQPR